MKRLLLVGATGPTGSFVAQEYLTSRFRIHGTFRSTLPKGLPDERLLYFKADCNHPESLLQAAQGCEVLVSCVHLSHAATLIEVAREAGIHRLVFLSSARILSTIPDPTIEQLKAGEKRIQESGLEFTILRPTMIYGHANDRNLFPLFEKVGQKRIHFLPDGGAKLMQPVHVQDVAKALHFAVDVAEAKGKTLTIAGPEPLPLRCIYEELAKCQNRSIKIISVPLGFVDFLATYCPTPLMPKGITKEAVHRLRENVVIDLAETQRVIPFSPRAFSEGIQSFVLPE